MSEWMRSGLSDTPITLGGQWSNDDGFDALVSAFGEPTQEVVFIPESHTLWRLEVWKQRYRVRCTMESHSDTFGTHCTFTPVQSVVIERAEWWRLALWYLCAPVRWIQAWRPEPPK
jgi:hypothetical protein